MNIKDILLSQKKELTATRGKNYIKRNVKLEALDKPLIKVIAGPRRAGKSFFAIHELVEAGYVNFDDERIINLKNYDETIEAVKNIYKNPRTIFLDEIQNLSGWELFVNRLQRQNYNLVISGSNANLLSRELSTHLTGRHINILILPFSFKEYLDFFDKQYTEPEIKAKFETYVENGGYPEPLVYGLDYKDYLKTLFDSILFKDIVKRYSIRYPKELENLAKQLVSNFCGQFSYGKLRKTTDIGSVHTVKKYVGCLEETFLIFALKRFSFKVKEQEKANRKIYVLDNGFINAVSFSFSENSGRLYENLVAIELKKRELKGELELFYYMNDYEVDFVIKKGKKVTQLIQVCFALDNEDTKQREIRGLLYGSRDLKCDKLIVITRSREGTETVSWFGMKKEISYIPLWKWPLEGSS